MKHLLLFTSILITTAVLASQPPDTLWTRQYEQTGAKSVIAASDGGYVMCGWVLRTGENQPEAYARKVDWLGNVVWTGFWGGGNIAATFEDVLELTDGSFVFCGGIASTYTEPFIVKTSGNGDEAWSITYAPTPNIWGASLIARSVDGTMAVVGSHRTDEVASIDPYLMILNEAGNVLSTHVFPSGPISVGEMNAMAPCPQGGWVMAGHRDDLHDTTDSGHGGWVIRTDGLGDTLWTFFSPRLRFVIIHALANGEIAIGGYEGEFANLYLRLDATGHELWRRPLLQGNNNLILRAGCGSDDGRLVYVFRNTEDWAVHRSILLMTDTNGDSLWTKGIGNWPWWVVEGSDVAGTPEQGLIWLNYIAGNTPAEDRQYLVKLRGEGPFVAPIADAFGFLHAYPNPFNESLIIEFYAYRDTQFQLKVFDVLGRLCRDFDLGPKNFGRQRAKLALPGLSSGSYFGYLVADNTSYAFKIQLLR